ncbi:MAG: hypothetical protein AAF938_18055 [Myxococcota bacterium]
MSPSAQALWLAIGCAACISACGPESETETEADAAIDHTVALDVGIADASNDRAITFDAEATIDAAPTPSCTNTDAPVWGPRPLDSVDAVFDDEEIALAYIPTGERRAFLDVLRDDASVRVAEATSYDLVTPSGSDFRGSAGVDLSVSPTGYALGWHTVERVFDSESNHVFSTAIIFDREGVVQAFTSTRGLPRDAYGVRVFAASPQMLWSGSDAWFTWTDVRSRQRQFGNVTRQAGVYGVVASAQRASASHMLIEWASSRRSYALAAAPEGQIRAAWISGGSDRQPYTGALPVLGTVDPLNDDRLADIKDIALAGDTTHVLYGRYSNGIHLATRRGDAPFTSLRIETIADDNAQARLAVAGEDVWLAWAANSAGGSSEVGWSEVADDASAATVVRDQLAELLNIRVLADRVQILAAYWPPDGPTTVELHQRCF